MQVEQMLQAYARADAPSIATDGRTDGRTYAEHCSPTSETSPLGTRGRAYDDSPLADLIEEAIDALEAAYERMPVVRSGEREPIPAWLRTAIYCRDEYTCQWCASRFGMLHLDHIVPWSAGGGDNSANLRTLCAGCNEVRSNRATDRWARALPVGFCDDCAHESGDDAPTAIYCPTRLHRSTTSNARRIW